MVRKVLSLVVGLWLVALGVVVYGQNAGGWKLPANAAEEKNPFPTNDSHARRRQEGVLRQVPALPRPDRRG